MIQDAHIYEELFNICHNKPVWPGGTISHRTADICGSRGWAVRDDKGRWVPTQSGVDALVDWVRSAGVVE